MDRKRGVARGTREASLFVLLGMPQFEGREFRRLSALADSMRDCFKCCVSLRDLRLPVSVREIGWHAFDCSGIREMDLGHAFALGNVEFNGAVWLKKVKLARRLEIWYALPDAYRLADLTCGLCRDGNLARLRRFRAMVMRRPLGEEIGWTMASARVTGEIVASAGRPSVPALP